MVRYRAWLCCRSSAFDSDFRTQMYFFPSRCSMQTFVSVDQPKRVWQWCNGDGRRSRSRSRAGPQGVCDNGSGAGGRSSREGLSARRRPLSGRGSPPQSGGWPHPRSGSLPRGGGGGGGSDRPCEASPRQRERCSGPVDWRQPLRDGGSGARADGSPPHSRDLRPDRLPSEDRRPPARADAHRGGGRGGAGGGGHHGGGGGGGGGGCGYGREDEGSGAGPTPCWLPHRRRRRLRARAHTHTHTWAHTHSG